MMNRLKKKSAALLALACVGAGVAQAGISLLPLPQRMETAAGSFQMEESVGFAAAEGTEQLVAFFAKELKNSTGWEVPVQPQGAVRFSIHPEVESGYWLRVSPAGIELGAADLAGLSHGFQTLLQLCPPAVYSQTNASVLADGWNVPCLTVWDAPRYAWRGILVDVSREFQTKEEMFKLLDSMAMVKLNVLHWHLTDDQGWRPEIKAYPKLTSGGSKFYSQQDLREIVAHAVRRGITIVPEIDVPGHSAAVARAYPELCVAKPNGTGRYNVYDVSNPAVYVFLETVIAELAAIFPGEYIHLGADEVNTRCWLNDAGCLAYMEKNGLKTAGELQSHFVVKVSAIIKRHGRKAIAWDEALHEDTETGLTIMSWRGVEPGMEAAQRGHNVVLCPVSALYYDRAQSRSDAHPPGYSQRIVVMSQSYFFEPGIPTLVASAKSNIMGAQGCVWGEKINGGDHLQRQVMLRGAALAESLWSPREALDWNSYLARLETHRSRLDARGVPYWWEPETTPAKVGHWQSVAKTGTHEVDVSKYVAQAGVHEFLFHYKQGEGTFRILKAELLKAGNVVATDAHTYTGTIESRQSGQSYNQFYLLKLTDYEPGVKYTLRYQIEAVQGGCSGVVMLIPPLEKSRYAAERDPEREIQK